MPCRVQCHLRHLHVGEEIQNLVCLNCVSVSHFVTPQDPSCVATNQMRRVLADHGSQHHPGFQTLHPRWYSREYYSIDLHADRISCRSDQFVGPVKSSENANEPGTPSRVRRSEAVPQRYVCLSRLDLPSIKCGISMHNGCG